MQTTLPASIQIENLIALSVPQKLEIIGLLWDSIDSDPAVADIPQWQLDELDRRDADDLKNPKPSYTWDETIARIRQQNASER